jgi:hypothetical protein
VVVERLDAWLEHHALPLRPTSVRDAVCRYAGLPRDRVVDALGVLLAASPRRAKLCVGDRVTWVVRADVACTAVA